MGDHEHRLPLGHRGFSCHRCGVGAADVNERGQWLCDRCADLANVKVAIKVLGLIAVGIALGVLACSGCTTIAQQEGPPGPPPPVYVDNARADQLAHLRQLQAAMPALGYSHLNADLVDRGLCLGLMHQQMAPLDVTALKRLVEQTSATMAGGQRL